MDSHHSTRPRWARRFVALAGAAILPTVVACAPPGSGNTVTAPTDPIPVNIDLGTDPIELTLYDGAGLKKIDEAMIAAFTERHPNVTITARYDPDEVQAVNAPRVLASENPPDIARIIALPAAVANHQLTELDPWADAYGWNELPEEQMAMYRVGANGVRGTGPQYTMASGFTLTGLYYNKDLATRIGMTSPPITVEQFEQALASAKTAGLIPVMAGNKSAQVTFLVQMMLNSALGQDTVNDWVFNAPGATLDTPAGVDAAAVVADWAAKGYFPSDTNGTDATTAAGRFAAGEALFYVSGNWDAATLQTKMGENVGFTLPPAPAGAPVLAMSDPVSNFAIPAGSDDKNAAAAFLNFLRSDAGRQVAVDAGFAPSGTGDVPATAPGSLGSEIQVAFSRLVASGGQVQFVQNATNGMSGTWLPQVQMLVAGRTTPDEMMAAVQSAYEQDLLR